MFLKSLTLKGFKSFSDTTTLDFEPGVTVVVGPNGSGKSNIVDAVAWVLGAQGPKALRSGKMDDVIFAGTSRRAALGRAEVALTIDNGSRRLPIEASEVTVTRVLFRSGDSEYLINGASCRLLDVQELFSDAGVGRQQHVIVGQGQLDQVLTATAEDRRAMIEEAAGIRKFRRRRERAERRLDTTGANLERLGDLVREVRREQRPLERQAGAARRHDGLVAELRALRAFQAGRELGELERRGEKVREQQEQASDRLRAIDLELARLDEVIGASDAATAVSRSGDARLAVTKLESLRQRTDGLARLVAERERAVAAQLASDAAQAIGMLEADRLGLVAVLATAEEESNALGPEWDALAGDEALLQERRGGSSAGALGAGAGAGAPRAGGLAVGGTDVTDRHDLVTRARIEAAAQRQALAHSRETLARISERASSLGARRSELVTALSGSKETIEATSLTLEEATAEASSSLAAAETATAAESAMAESLRLAEQESHTASARADTLAAALEEARARAGVERLAGVAGVLGALQDLVEIDRGFEQAFQAAAEGALDGVVVDGVESARQALALLRSTVGGGAVIAAPEPAGSDPLFSLDRSDEGGGAGPGLVPLREHVHAVSLQVSALLDDLLRGLWVCEAGFEAALAAAAADRRRTVVTASGDRFGASGWRVGSAGAAATRVAVDQAVTSASNAQLLVAENSEAARVTREEAAAARRAAEVTAATVARLQTELAHFISTRQETVSQVGEIDAALEAIEKERLACEQLTLAQGKQLSEAESRVAELEAFETAVAAQLAAEREARSELEERALELTARRSGLEIRSAALDERRAMVNRRIAEIDDRLAANQAARIAAQERRDVLETSSLALGRFLSRLEDMAELVAAGLESAARAAAAAATAAEQASESLATARSERSQLEKELVELRERDRRLGIEEAEVRLRRESCAETLARDLDMQPEQALAAPRPELPDGVTPASRARELDRELRLLGPVNPLAEEELKALVERSSFLDRELEDVRSARRELGRVIRAIDAEIASVFEAAFADVSQHFEVLVETLFPGGAGRLCLTPADSPLNMGVEIEARPAGRHMRRLSLLSGGERSLVALAFLFAVFRSRPSPFYLLDEVEAALDDINLHRFLDLLDEFRSEAQLIIVSHQKRTMEAADALYGVTMPPGGSSKVVSERVARTSG